MKNFNTSISTVVILFVVAGIALSYQTYLNVKQTSVEREKLFDGKITALQKQISSLQEKITKITGENSQVALSLTEIKNRQQVREKSQDDLLTGAVAQITPSVVSIVISKDVPKLEVTYQNPFGDDPFFGNIGFQIPVYQQKGVEHKKVGAGTGFIVTKDGYILTNKHVVADTTADYTVLLSNGSQKKATVSYRDPSSDIAIVKIDGSNYPTVTFGDSSSLKLGQTVVAVGNALGEYNNSVSVGIISGLNRTVEASGASGSETLSGIIQTDAAINPGNSGGPLIDIDGKVIGINVATVVGSSNISFAIPVNTIKSVTSKILKI